MQHILDLDRYPLDRPGTPEWDALVAKSRADLARDGMFNLPSLMRPSAIASAVAELTPRFETEAFTHARKHNIYFRPSVEGLAPDHPALALRETKSHTLCADQITSMVRALYDWPPFAQFLAATIGKVMQEELDKETGQRDVLRMIRVLEAIGVRDEAEAEVARHDAIALRELDAIDAPEERKVPLRALADMLMVRTH